MDKRLRLFITVAVILVVIAGVISIREIAVVPANSEITERQAEEFGIEVENQVYVIGQYLFTEKTSYISKAMILEAAKTAEDITEDMTEEQILSKIKIYARDAEGNWINAMTGEKANLGTDFKFDIKYVDSTIVSELAKSEEEFITAFENNKISTITLGSNITLNDTLKIVNGKKVTIELNGKDLNITNIGDKNNFSFEVNGGDLVINGPGKIITHESKTNIGNMSGTVELNNVTMLGGYNIKANWKNSGGETTTTINNSILTATNHSCVAAWKGAEVHINKSTLTGRYSAVSANGTADKVNIDIKGCTLSATCKEENSVIYMPCEGILKIEDTSLEGHTGISACAGTIDVKNSTITATGDYWTSDRVEANGSSMWCDGSAIILRSQKEYDNGGELTLNIDKTSKISSTNGPAIRIHEYSKNTAAAHGVNSIEVNYHSDKATSGSGFDKVVEEKLDTPLTEITVNDLSNTTSTPPSNIVNTIENIIDSTSTVE